MKKWQRERRKTPCMKSKSTCCSFCIENSGTLTKIGKSGAVARRSSEVRGRVDQRKKEEILEQKGVAKMEPKRHVSRWHAAVDGSDSSRNGRTPVAATVAAGAASEALASGKPPVSLRYLNEFVGKLQCAPALLEHKLYPDAKEITEVALCARLHVYVCAYMHRY